MSSTNEIVPPAAVSSGNDGEGSARPNPVALEVPVNVTGARPGGTAGSRDLFSEDTTTVLIFQDGAVIQLAAGVAVGQLLFLTLKKNQQEVVCQVLRKRNHKPTVCYVEVQFTEEKPDFWGVAFPTEPKEITEFTLVEHVQAAEPTEENQGAAVAAPNANEADLLSKEVDALRRQLQELEKKKAAETAKGTGEITSLGKEGESAKSKVDSEEKRLPDLSWEPEGEPPAREVQSSELKVEIEEKKPQDSLPEAKGGVPEPARFSKEKLELASVNEQTPVGGKEVAGGPSTVLGTSEWRAASKSEGVESSKLKVEKEAKTQEEQEKQPEKRQEPVLEGKSEPPTPTDSPTKAAESAEKATETPLMPAAQDKDVARRPVIGMKLPSLGGGENSAPGAAKDPEDELLPKPELDFSKMPQSAVYLDEKDPRSIYKQVKAVSPKVRMIGLSALLLVGLAGVVGGAWYGKVWRYLPTWKRSAPVKAVAAAKTSSVAAPAAANVGTPNATATSVTGTAGTGAKPEAKEEKAAETATHANAVENTNPAEVNGTGEAAPENAVGNSVPLAGKRVATGKEKASKNKSEAAASKAGEASAAEPAASDAPFVPAKLLRTATPVYPQEAMMNYVTGDVKAEVEVETNGSVGEVKVISGPKALRDAAVEALKRYQYAPATQGGKAIVSKATVTVKFWFDLERNTF